VSVDRADDPARRPAAARLPPLPAAEFDASIRAQLDGRRAPEAPSAAIPNIFTTLARHSDLFQRWLPFAGKLLFDGTLSGRDRELLILRTAWNCRSPYEWGQHDPIGRSAGLTEAEIARVPAGPDAPEWDPFDATLLRAADELHRAASISDQTWAALADRYDERQLIEVPMLVGHYHMVAFALNALGVELDPGIAGLPGDD
jgi:alkylhydroperoxidase family enzyme